MINREEQITYDLKKLYENSGFMLYKMRKFEEYSLYLENKNFLSDSPVITFTDVRGKLLALKPDVTLSVVKNASSSMIGDGRLYYNENVYRFDKRSGEYKEINQLGLEVIGKTDYVMLTEIVCLAIETLKATNEQFVLAINDVNVLEGLFEIFNITSCRAKKTITNYVDKKNTHDLKTFCDEKGIDTKFCDVVMSVINGNDETLDILEKIADENGSAKLKEASEKLKIILNGIPCELVKNVVIDLSLTADTDYYSGIVINGYIESIPHAILSGGQYDKLVQKFNKDLCAMGFALNVSELSVLNEKAKYVADVQLVYGETEPKTVIEKMNRLKSQGKSVILKKSYDQSVKTKETVTL